MACKAPPPGMGPRLPGLPHVTTLRATRAYAFVRKGADLCGTGVPDLGLTHDRLVKEHPISSQSARPAFSKIGDKRRPHASSGVSLSILGADGPPSFRRSAAECLFGRS